MQILEEFHNIFGPELKGVTGDPKCIDEMLCKLDGLLLHIEEVSFNPFNICKSNSWKMVMQDVDTTVQVSLTGVTMAVLDQHHLLKRVCNIIVIDLL